MVDSIVVRFVSIVCQIGKLNIIFIPNTVFSWRMLSYFAINHQIITVLLLLALQFVAAFSFNIHSDYRHLVHSKMNPLYSSSELPSNFQDKNDRDMTRELDIFFERAAEKGASATKKLSPRERAERAIIGEGLEDEICDIRDEISTLSRSALNGNQEANDDIKRLRERMMALKQQYIEVVGGNDLPIYFGKTPDSLQ